MIWIELAYNLSLLVALSVVTGFVDARWDRRRPTGQLLQGLLFGAAAMVGMLKPFVLSPGLVFDGRSVMVSCGALFFGPLTALVSCAMTIPLRVAQGGNGMWMGVVVILASAAIGTATHRRHRDRHGPVSAPQLLAFGLAVHVAMLAATLALPRGMAGDVLRTIAVPVLVVYPLATVLVGKILSDQSAARQMLASLRASEARYRHLSDSTLDVIWAMDLDLVFTYANPAISQHTGHTVEEWVGSRLADHCDAEHLAQMEKIVQREITKGPGNQGITFETEMRRRDGSPLPVEIHAQIVFGDDGVPTGVQGVSRDISERRRHELRLAHLVQVLRGIRNVNQLITHERQREPLLRQVCATLTETRGYGAAWIGIRDETGDRFVTVVQSGLDASIDGLSAAIREGDLPACCRLALEREGAVAIRQTPEGCRDCLCLESQRGSAALTARLAHGSRDYGVIVVSLPEDMADQEEERQLFAELAGDIAHALHSIGLAEARDGNLRDLSESREQLRRSIMDAPLPAMIHAEDGEVILINRAWLAITGYTTEEIATTEAWTRRASGEGWREALAAIARLYDGETSGGRQEFTIRCRNGESRIWTFQSTILGRDRQGRRSALSMAVDVTEQKRHERESVLRSAADRMRAAVAQVGAEGDTAGLRHETAELLRWAGFSFDEFSLCLVDPEKDRVSWLGAKGWRHSLAKEMEDASSTLVRAWRRRQIVNCPDLHAEDPLGLRARLEEEHGHVVRAVLEIPFPRGVLALSSSQPDAFPPDAVEELAQLSEVFDDIAMRLTDIWSLRESESQLLQARKIEAVGQLAGGVAHDFNNMIMGIMGYAELCREDIGPDHPAREWLNEITGEAQRSAKLTRQLLAFARQQTISPEVLDLNDTVGGTIKLLLRLIGEDIDLDWQPAAGLWSVNVDPGQIDQILVNLCVNARDAIGRVGKVTIETGRAMIDSEYCTRHPDAAPGAYVMLAVSDNGCGMDRTTQERIFEPFFTTKAVGEGTGLGLATLYGIVRQNNGFVNVYSEPGEGTTFRIYLPRCGGELEEEAVPDAGDGRPRGTETILLVEDEKSVRTPTTRLLERLGYTVFSAADPDSAIALMAQHAGSIDMLVTDVVMPGMGGPDLAAKLTAEHPEMKCLFVSGYTAKAIARHGILGADVEFLPKPFTHDEIARKVRDVLDA